jgi:hypothetical protein
VVLNLLSSKMKSRHTIIGWSRQVPFVLKASNISSTLGNDYYLSHSSY